MNILEINKFYYNRRGAEKHMLDVMALFESKGDAVAVFSMQHPHNFETKWGKYFVSYVGYNADDSTRWQKIKGIARMFWSFEARTHIQGILKDFQPDIVHIHNIYHQISPSILKPLKQSGAKIIMTVHDYNLISPDKDAYYPDVNIQYWRFLSHPQYGFVKRLLLILKMYWEKMLDTYEQTVDAYIVPSEYVKRTLSNAGMDEKRIHVIPHFIALTSAIERSHTPVEVPLDAGLHQESVSFEKFALYFGSISTGKSVLDLIKIFEALQFPLVLAGNIEEGLQLPESKWVQYVGHQSSQNIKLLIRRAEFVVSASMLPETFGLIALEAIAEGKVFFGMHVGALPEIIDSSNGVLAKDYDTLRIGIQQYLQGGLGHFATKEDIQTAAHKKFGANTYHEQFMKLYSSLK